MVVDCIIHLLGKNVIKWNGINKSMSQNGCPNSRRRFQHSFFDM